MAYGPGLRAAHWARLLPRSKEKMKEGLRTLQPWAWTLKRIGGVLGSEGGGWGLDLQAWC